MQPSSEPQASESQAIYLNAASHGRPSPATLQRMIDHLEAEQTLGLPASTHAPLGKVRTAAASLIGASPEDLGFAFTTFGAWSSLVDRLELTGRHVLIAPHEWGDNVRYLGDAATRHGFAVEVLPPLDPASPNLRLWAEKLGDDVAALFVPMVTSVQGLRYPVEQIAALPRPEGCTLVVDAAQALGQAPIDVRRLGCDALVATGRKWLRGPRGAAIFWRHPDRMGRVTIADVEPFDANVAVRLGLGQAIAEAQARTIPRIAADIGTLRAHAMQRADALGLGYFGGVAPQTGAICLAVPSAYAGDLRARLEAAQVTVKWPDAARSEPNAPSVPGDAVPLRLTPHVYNTTGEIDAVFEHLSGVLA